MTAILLLVIFLFWLFIGTRLDTNLSKNGVFPFVSPVLLAFALVIRFATTPKTNDAHWFFDWLDTVYIDNPITIAVGFLAGALFMTYVLRVGK